MSMSTKPLPTDTADREAYLTDRDVARLIGVRPAIVRAWRAQDIAPPHVILGNVVRYPYTEFSAWLLNLPRVHGIPQLPAAVLH